MGQRIRKPQRLAAELVPRCARSTPALHVLLPTLATSRLWGVTGVGAWCGKGTLKSDDGRAPRSRFAPWPVRVRAGLPEADKAAETELVARPKERAEHVMLIDLARNDIRPHRHRLARSRSRMPLSLSATATSCTSSAMWRHLAAWHDQHGRAQGHLPAGTLTGAPSPCHGADRPAGARQTRHLRRCLAT